MALTPNPTNSAPKLVRDTVNGERRTMVYLFDNGQYGVELYRWTNTPLGYRWIPTYNRIFTP